MTPKKVKPLTADTKSHSKFEPNMICSFGAILAWKSADVTDDGADDYDDDRKSDPYMSPSYAGDTIKPTFICTFQTFIAKNKVRNDAFDCKNANVVTFWYLTRWAVMTKKDVSREAMALGTKADVKRRIWFITWSACLKSLSFIFIGNALEGSSNFCFMISSSFFCWL